MTDTPAQVRAQLASPGEWGVHGSAVEHQRYAVPLPGRYRRRCCCGCGGRSTHAGHANGVALMSGCEWHVRKWVQDPFYDAQRRREVP